jgi:DNA modification methylase
MDNFTLLVGDAATMLATMPDSCARTCVTSPPYYGLRDYGVDGQIGLEPTPQDYVATLVDVFRQVRRVLTDDGTLWLNLGDSYASNGTTRWPDTTDGYGKHGTWHGGEQVRANSGGLSPKQLLGIPWRVAFALQADGWYLRQDIIWHKPNPMPESVTDRCTKAHEYIFLLSKQPNYYFDAAAIKEPATNRAPGNITHKSADQAASDVSDGNHLQRTKLGLKKIGAKDLRNKRSVWTVPVGRYAGAHFATFPEALILPCILAGSAEHDCVLDPFTGSGTTAAVALGNGRRFLGCELNPDYASMARARCGWLALPDEQETCHHAATR